jgi:hypothetical protein
MFSRILHFEPAMSAAGEARTVNCIPAGNNGCREIGVDHVADADETIVE